MNFPAKLADACKPMTGIKLGTIPSSRRNEQQGMCGVPCEVLLRVAALLRHLTELDPGVHFTS